MTQLDPVLAELAGRLGVATEYDDWVGTRVQVAESTLVAVLSALGVDADTVESRVNSAFELDRRHWQLRLPPTTVAQTGTAAKVWAHVPHGSPARVWVRCEDGTTAFHGLFGDAWLSCSLRIRPAGDADLDRVGRWCATVAQAAGS